MKFLSIFNKQQKSVESFSFGEPVPVLDGYDLMEYFELAQYGKYYEPPVPWQGISKSYRSAVHHQSALQLKINLLASTFIPNKLFNHEQFIRYATNFLIFGNAYIERRNNRLKEPLSLFCPLTKYVRRGIDLEQYYQITTWNQEYEFKKGSIFHLMEPDINQDIYGMPYYMAGLNSAFLNESATIYRRLYYKNGSPGHILYITDAQQNQTDIEALKEAMKQQKGPGKFRNLFLYAPNGKKDGVQVIPVGEVMTKDEFFNVKTLTRDDQLAIHRIPPQLMGVVPANTGGFGDALAAAQIFGTNELQPIQSKLMALNEWLGIDVVRFKPYALAQSPAK
jgi:PBSX family phage portal protein